MDSNIMRHFGLIHFAPKTKANSQKHIRSKNECGSKNQRRILRTFETYYSFWLLWPGPFTSSSCRVHVVQYPFHPVVILRNYLSLIFQHLINGSMYE